jgi:predicted lysophospholipase L1 biosynthesis ABC-type transport system permease subunit
VYGHAPVVVVNARLAREYWKTPSAAIGRRVRASTQGPWREIIGVVGDERDNGLAQAPPPIIYYPALIKDFWVPGVNVQATMTYVVRSTRTGSAAFAKEIREAVWAIDRNVPLARVQTLATNSHASMAQTSFALVMLGIAATVSLLLGIVGVYGVISYVTAQRRREVGIRMALGAQPGDVVRLFVRQGVVLAAVGVAIGAVAAAGTSRLMASLLFGVTARDPLTFIVTSVGLAATAVLAGYLPSRRATRVDPNTALRSE